MTGLAQLTEFRQSTLRALEVCPRRTRFALESGELTTGWTGGSTRLGTVFHEFAAEYLRTLQRPECRGERKMATEDAMAIMREVYAASPYVLDADAYHALVGMTLRFCDFEWRTERILFLEEPLRAEILCSDGEIRTLKGQPDVVFADPPYGVVIEDWKTGQGWPKAPRKLPEDAKVIEGREYLSDVGKFQREVYGYLVLKQLPAARYAILRERPMRYPGEPPREARLAREALEHVEPRIAAAMMKLDRGVSEGSGSEVWAPIPGSQCNHCEAARSCPVPPGLRGAGAIGCQSDADVEARRFIRGGAMRVQASERLKAWQEAGNPPGRLSGREEVRWGPERDAWMVKGGGRKFEVWPQATEGETRGSE